MGFCATTASMTYHEHVEPQSPPTTIGNQFHTNSIVFLFRENLPFCHGIFTTCLRMVNIQFNYFRFFHAIPLVCFENLHLVQVGKSVNYKHHGFAGILSLQRLKLNLHN